MLTTIELGILAIALAGILLYAVREIRWRRRQRREHAEVMEELRRHVDQIRQPADPRSTRNR